MQLTISSFLSQIENDENHRFTSWENCFKTFQETEDRELLALHLAFYLASWGMYRGSSGLLQKNHKIHNKAVDIILDYKHLQCSHLNEVAKSNINDIINLVTDLEKHYDSIQFQRNTRKLLINPTITLTTKIIMGTLGCLPAMDRYFIKGVKEKGFNFNTLSLHSLEDLFDYVEINDSKEIINNQTFIKSKRDIYYPKMKIVDMYFWQTGYNLSKEN